MIVTKIIDIRKPARDKAIITLSAPVGFSYQAGQYVQISFGGCEPRHYSVANAPDGRTIEVHIRDNGRGGAATYAVQSLCAGDDVTLEGPFGNTVWTSGGQRSVLMIAGGMGIVPIKALIDQIAKRGHAQRVDLFWGAREEDDFYLRDYFESLSAEHSFFHCHFIAGADMSVNLFERIPSFEDHDIYLSGPVPMIETLTPQLISRGAVKEFLFGDHL